MGSEIRNNVLDILYSSIAEANEMLDPGDRLAQAADTVIAGSHANLDSLGYVNLILISERRLSEAFSRSVPLASKLFEGDSDSAPTSVDDLAVLVMAVLGES